MPTLEAPLEPVVVHGSTRFNLLRRAFSFPCLLAIVLVGSAFVLQHMFFRIDGDTWWHLLVGERILSTHHWPVSDIYSFSAPGAEWIAYEWLSEVILAWAARLAGLAGLMGLVFALTSAVLLLVYYYAYLRSRNSKAAFVATWAVLPLASVWFAVHPYLFGYIYLLVTLICLERFREGHRRSLWLLPLVFCLWVNSHGSFTLGAAVFGIYWLGGLVKFRAGRLLADAWTASERLQLAVVALLSLLAGCVTPYGTQLAAYPLQMIFFQQGITKNMTSWNPIPLNQWHGEGFLILVLLFIVALATGRFKLRPEELGMFLFAVFMTAEHARALPLFAFVVAPFLAAGMARWVPAYEPAKDKYVLNAVLIGLAILGFVWYFPSRQHLEQEVAKTYPQAAVEYLRQHPLPGPMLNELTWGGYLPYMLGPQQRVFIDGRLDFYQYRGVWPDYLRITKLERDTPRLLAKYNIQACLVPPSRDIPLVTFLEASPDWKKVYEDDVAVLFVHRQAGDSKIETQKQEVEVLNPS
jgi:hypothetical protein